MKTKNRRSFMRDGGLMMTGGLLTGSVLLSCSKQMSDMTDTVNKTVDNASSAVKDAMGGDMFFKLSLAQWSLHKALFAKEMDHLDFAAKTRELDIDGVEYVNQFFKDKAEDTTYLNDMNRRASDAGVKQLLIMVDGEGGLGDTDDAARTKAVENHYRWVNAAKYLGCHSIRVNAYGEGAAEDVGAAAVNGLARVAEYGAKEGINVIVENHGGYSSDGSWLSGVMSKIDMKNCGTLPDFGNFCIQKEPGKGWAGKCINEYDRYKGVTEMMPFAKAVSAKSHDFNASGDEIHTDFMKMMKIVKEHGYKGFVGIEYEGSELSEIDGIKATRDLLRKVGKQLS